MINNEKNREEIESLIGKEILTAKELALYLYVDEKTIKNYIKKLYQSEDGLKKTDFFINGKYIVKPEIQNIFIILVDVNWGMNHKRQSKYKEKISERLVSKIENQLEAEDQKKMLSSEPYLNAKIDREYIEQYFLAWYMLNETIFQTDTKVRFKYIERTICQISRMRKTYEITNRNIKISEKKVKDMMPAYLLDKEISASLEKSLISLMVEKLRRTEISNEPDVNVLIRKLAFNLESFDLKDLNEKRELIQKWLFPLDRREQIEKKIDSIFDLTDDIESKIAQYIKDTFDDVYFGAALKEKGEERNIDIQGIKEDMYKNFFKEYIDFSQCIEIIQSKEYKKYLEIKDTEEFKKFLSKTTEN